MPLISLEQALSQSFDYIIIGGGVSLDSHPKPLTTAGLVVASRLSEDPTVTVLVLDAGNPNLDEPLITRLCQYGFQFGNPQFDWAHKIAPQKHLAGKEFVWPRGKSLGGSSAMNFSFWSVPPKEDIDDWERLGNKGWNWDNYHKYQNKTVTYVPLDASSRADAELLKVWDLEKHSSGTGPLVVTHPRKKFEIDYKVYDAFREMGVSPARAPYHGDIEGLHVGLNTVDPKNHLRNYAATAHFRSITERSNLLVLPTAYAHKLVTTGEKDGDIVATGVEFSFAADKSVHVAHAKREVIVSAGQDFSQILPRLTRALKSPQILELSGIGSEDVLSKIGVPVKVSLPGVGENVQEHCFLAAAFELREDTKSETLDVLRDEKQVMNHVQLLLKGEGAYTTGLTNVVWIPFSQVSPQAEKFYEEQRRRIEEDAKKNLYSPGLLDQYEILLERLRNKSPGSEFCDIPGFFAMDKPPVPGKKYVALCTLLNHPFSRGTIHSSTNDPLADPDIDPQLWDHPIAVEYAPGPEVETDEQLAEWGAQKGLYTTFHTAGSCSMLPREKNGVVDTHLKVYGTKNIRVVDLSIAPLHFAAHSQATVYTIAEIAADIIKGRFSP
ncbi:hypothetical protein V5O48_011980 [Marasmius crinis-equi]|uniref:Glucose-methanol-choline oxidoreductase N-terminal domain-containing protein n=1 Tax=Marasmius crinis-equi TaxID=585013 RepID=A0ABR3F4C7_9AGAR